MSIRFTPGPTMTLSAVSAALMIACAGTTETEAVPLSNQTATHYTAIASAVAADASGALDATLATATQLVTATAHAAKAGRRQALALSKQGLHCAGGGQAKMTISGANSAEEVNSRLDAGEVYQIAFVDCRSAAGSPALNGGVTMAVISAGDEVTAVNLSTTTLMASLPRGTLSLIGSAGVQRRVAVNGTGSEVTTRITASGLSVGTDVNGHSANFTLSDVDLTRQAAHAAGTLQSTRLSGTHSLSGTIGGEAFDFGVATQAAASFNALGAPTQGTWVLTLPREIVTIGVENATATIEIDEGKDGSVERSFAVPIALLTAGAG
jgi:hypothetical protein